MEDDPGTKRFNAVGEKIFQLSTGALALSITFRSSIAPSNAVYKWILSLAWISLSASTMYYVFFQAQMAQYISKSNSIVQDFKRRVEGNEKIDAPPDIVALTRVDVRRASTCWFITYFGFLFGMAFLLIFALLNNR